MIDVPVTRRRAMALLALLPAPLSVSARREWPRRAVRLVVPFAAGGAQDSIARELGQALASLWKQAVVVENRGGAAGVIGSEVVARADPDGYTILFGTEGPLVGAPFLQDQMPYDPLVDLVPVALVARFPLVLAAHPSLHVDTFAQLAAAARREPGAIAYASNGIGGSLHLAMKSLEKQTGLTFNHVAYKGGAPAVQDVIGGHVSMMFGSISTLRPYLLAGKLHAVGIASASRFPSLPDVPTFEEQGLPGFVAGSWGGLLLPKATPADVVAQLGQDLKSSVDSVAFLRFLTSVGAEPPKDRSASGFQTLLRQEFNRNACALKGRCNPG